MTTTVGKPFARFLVEKNPEDRSSHKALSYGEVTQKRTIKATQRARPLERRAKPVSFAALLKIIDHVPCSLPCG